MRCNLLFLSMSICVAAGCTTGPPLKQPGAARSPEIVFQALAIAGVPYRRGGQSPESGFDCSGLVAHVYREAFGIELPHNARAQSRVGRPVSLAALEAGDLVFYNTERRCGARREYAHCLLGQALRRRASTHRLTFNTDPPAGGPYPFRSNP
jgi:hypothetical protein